MSDFHALRRTSPKGTPFVGTCIKCGRANLPVSAAHERCDNPSRMTQDESVLNLIDSEAKTP